MKRPERYARRILYLQYTNPSGYPPLEHSSRILANSGWRVLALGTAAFGSEALRLPPHRNIQVQLLDFHPGGWKQKLHYVWFCLWTMVRALFFRPHWIYASEPLSCLPTLLATLLTRPRVVYHEHDVGRSTGSFFMRVAGWTRRCLSRRAHRCVLPNEERARQFAREIDHHPSRIVCVWNCPTRDEVGPPREPMAEGLRIYYHGTLNPSRLPPTFLHAVAELPRGVRLRMVGYETLGYVGYRDELRRLAREIGIANRVEVLDPVPFREHCLDLAGDCDVGIACMPLRSDDENLRTMAGASNKAFDYLARGLALLVSDLPDWRRLYVDTTCARVCDPEDKRSIVLALRWFLEHPRETRAMGERGRQRILTEWNYETQFAAVEKHLLS